MFAIGDKEWPGISKLTEEAGEVLQVCGKLLATAGKIEHWDGTNLKERLEDELGDLQAAINFVVGWCGLDRNRIERRVIAKLTRFERWHEVGEANHKALEG
jgi:NTP pyrophosphatase (non-canonical NTP hydrolase)